MSSAIVYFLFVVGSGALPNMTSLASYASLTDCKAAQVAITAVLKKGDEPQTLVCVASDSLQELAEKNP